MTLKHQTWYPNTCKCIIEEQFDDEDETIPKTILFFHSICSKHLPLVESKPQLKDKDLKQKREQIINHHRKLLDDNRIRHLKQFDEHPNRKQKLDTIKEMKKSLDTEQLGLRMEEQFNMERIKQEKFLDNHEDESMDFLLSGIHSTYAFISQEVYDKILEEQSEV